MTLERLKNYPEGTFYLLATSSSLKDLEKKEDKYPLKRGAIFITEVDEIGGDIYYSLYVNKFDEEVVHRDW